LNIQHRFPVRDHSKTTSPFAGGELGFWQGATKEQSQSSVIEEQRNQKPNSPQPEGAERRHAACGVTRRLNPHEGKRPSRPLHPTRRRSHQMVNLFLSDRLILLLGGFLLISARATSPAQTGVTNIQIEELNHPVGASSGFTELPITELGIDFINQLEPEISLKNRILENGSGVAAGDVNGDGLCDLYFSGLDSSNRLYINQGNWNFVDVTDTAGVACVGQYSTGCCLADMDGDGDLDLLVNGIGSGTRLFLNNGSAVYKEKVNSGLSRIGGSHSMALADFDKDGDLDLYVTHYRSDTWKDDPERLKPKIINREGIPFAEPGDRFLLKPLSNGEMNLLELGEVDHFYLNQGDGRFIEVGWTDGLFLDLDGNALKTPPRHWGLAVMFRDFTGDGYPDLYVCNDFEDTGDEVWINQSGSAFKQVSHRAFRNFSRSSMAVDIADIDRDGRDDLFVVEMLSRIHSRRMTQRAGEESVAEPLKSHQANAQPQYQKNSLYWNRDNRTYAEIGQFAGLEASEWSWNVAFLDVDLDGFEDLLVANGNAHDLLDGDANIAAMLAADQTRSVRQRPLSSYPRLEQNNLAFRNTGRLTFQETSAEWGFNKSGISQGMCLADLDRDGDLDIVLNNLQASPSVYRNNSIRPRISVRLIGASANTEAIGARIILRPGANSIFPMQSQELIKGGRYLSSDQAIRIFAADAGDSESKLEVIWTDGSRIVVPVSEVNRSYAITQNQLKNSSTADVIETPHVLSSHSSLSKKPLFERVPLPAFDVGEVRNPVEGLPRWKPPFHEPSRGGVAWFQTGRDVVKLIYLDASTKRIWISGESFADFRGISLDWPLEGFPSSIFSLPVRGNHAPRFLLGSQVDINSTRPSIPLLEFRLVADRLVFDKYSFPKQTAVIGPMILSDFDANESPDLFIGGRYRPRQYPVPAASRLYSSDQNRWQLDFQNSSQWSGVSMVVDAVAADFDEDGDTDLLTLGWWSPPSIWINDRGVFENQTYTYGLDRYNGWWNGLKAGDFDQDGRIDFIASNWGRNTRYQSYRREPLRIYFGDVDRNNTWDVFDAVFDEANEHWAPFHDIVSMGFLIPRLQRKYNGYAQYSRESLLDILGENSLKRLKMLEANWLETTVFLNRGDHFKALPLPDAAQWSPAFGIAVEDFNGDGFQDIVLGQNYFLTDSENPRFDAGQSLFLKGKGNGTFTPLSAEDSGLDLPGQTLGITTGDIDMDGRPDLIFLTREGLLHVFRNLSSHPSLKLHIEGPPENPAGIGTHLQLIVENGKGAIHELEWASHHGAQTGPEIFLPLSGKETYLKFRWPNNKQIQIPVPAGARSAVFKFPDSFEFQNTRIHSPR
jgi:hypothetical protein